MQRSARASCGEHLPSPSVSNSSIMACISRSASVSPRLLADCCRSESSMKPLALASNRPNARTSSSRRLREPIRSRTTASGAEPAHPTAATSQRRRWRTPAAQKPDLSRVPDRPCCCSMARNSALLASMPRTLSAAFAGDASTVSDRRSSRCDARGAAKQRPRTAARCAACMDQRISGGTGKGCGRPGRMCSGGREMAATQRRWTMRCGTAR